MKLLCSRISALALGCAAMKTTLLLSCVLGCLAIAGCGSPTSTGSCLLADHSRCTDYDERGEYLFSDQNQCELNGDTWTESACHTTGYVAGCRTSSGTTTQTVWYLDHSRTAGQIQSSCALTNGSFIPPAI